MKNKELVLLAVGTILVAANAAGAPIYTATSVSISYTTGSGSELESITFLGPNLDIVGSGGSAITGLLYSTPPNTSFSLTLPLLATDTGSNPASGSAGGVSYTSASLNLSSGQLLTFGPFVLPTGVFSANASGVLNGTVFACAANTACGASNDVFAIAFDVPVEVTIGAVQIAPNGYAITSATVTTAPEPATGLLSAGACVLLMWFSVRRRRTASRQSVVAIAPE